MELRINWKEKKIRIIGNIKAAQYKLLNEILQKLFDEDDDFMIVNEAETKNPLMNFPQQRPRPVSEQPYRTWIDNNPLEQRYYREQQEGLKRKDPFEEPWKMTYDNNDSITETILKTTCTACTGDCTHNILNPNPNKNV